MKLLDHIQHAGYRQRTRWVIIASLLLGALLLNKKVVPTYQLWQECQGLTNGDHHPMDQASEYRAMLVSTSRLDRRLGGEVPVHERWQTVLRQMDSIPAHIVSVKEDHRGMHGQLNMHTLPIVIEGNTEEILRSVDRSERNGGPVHLASVHLQASKAGFRKPRKLRATLHLQTVSK